MSTVYKVTSETCNVQGKVRKTVTRVPRNSISSHEEVHRSRYPRIKSKFYSQKKGRDTRFNPKKRGVNTGR